MNNTSMCMNGQGSCLLSCDSLPHAYLVDGSIGVRCLFASLKEETVAASHGQGSDLHAWKEGKRYKRG